MGPRSPSPSHVPIRLGNVLERAAGKAPCRHLCLCLLSQGLALAVATPGPAAAAPMAGATPVAGAVEEPGPVAILHRVAETAAKAES